MPETNQTPPSAGRTLPPGTPHPRTPEAYPQGFTRIDNRIISLYASQIGPSALAVYMGLCFHADNVTRTCFPALRTLSRRLGLSRTTVLKAISTLEAVGLVRVTRERTERGKPRVNVYTLLPVPNASANLPSTVHHLDNTGHNGLQDVPPKANFVNHVGPVDEPELDSINKTQLNQRGSECGQPAPTPPAQLDHLAVKAYQAVWGSPPDALQRAAIAAAVTDVPQWAEVVRQWRLAGYRKQNVAGMLDWYINGIPERSNGYGRSAGGGRAGGGLGFASQRSGNRAGEWHTSSQTETPEERARFDAEWAAYLQASRNRSESDAA